MSSIPPTGFVVGLAVEARLLAEALGEAAPIACAAARPERARDGAERLLSQGVGALVSFGIAGGLDPNLIPGDLVLPDRITAVGQDAIATDPDLRARWQGAAAAAGLRPNGGSLLGGTHVVVGVAEKRRLHESSGAVAVDMESRVVAQAAAAAGVPFLAVRAVADPAGRPLPRAVIGSIGPAGAPRIGRVMGRVCLRPWEVPQLLQLRRDSDAALASLSRLIGGFGAARLS